MPNRTIWAAKSIARTLLYLCTIFFVISIFFIREKIFPIVFQVFKQIYIILSFQFESAEFGTIRQFQSTKILVDSDSNLIFRTMV